MARLTRIDSLFRARKPVGARRAAAAKLAQAPQQVLPLKKRAAAAAAASRRPVDVVRRLVEYIQILRRDDAVPDADALRRRIRRQLDEIGDDSVVLVAGSTCMDCDQSSDLIRRCSNCFGTRVRMNDAQRPAAFLASSPEVMQSRVVAASLRALDVFDQLMQTKKADEFATFGGDALFLFRFVAERAIHDEVRLAALKYVRGAMRRWDQHHPSLSPPFTASHLLYYAEAVHAKLFLQPHEVERHRRELRQALRRFPRAEVVTFSPQDPEPLYLAAGMCSGCFKRNPVRAASCVGCRRDLRRTVDYQSMFFALVWAGLFAEIDVDLQGNDDDHCVTVADVLRHLNRIRPYRSCDDLGLGSFKAQCYFVTHLVYVMSDWGRVVLDPVDFAEELTFLVANVEKAIRIGDPEIVGEMLQCLRIFGAGEDDLAVQKGVAYLLQKEKSMKKGNWVKPTKTYYQRYHAAYCGLIGLNPFQFRPRRPLPQLWHDILYDILYESV